MLRRNVFVLLATLLFPFAVFAQAPAAKSTSPEVLKELDRDIWLPFIKAYGEGNPDGYIALHSKSFVRPMGDIKRIDTYEQWSNGTRAMFKSFADRGSKTSIQFRFLERFANAESASERGIYEFTSINAKGETRKTYGKFHVISRKEDGKWKILVDYDSTEGRSIDEAAFKAAYAQDDYAKY
jgi:hypothetical protein